MRVGLWRVSLSSLMLLLGSIALLASACGGASGGATATATTDTGPANRAKDQILSMIWNSDLVGTNDIPTIDPALASDTSAIPIVDMVFDGLVVLDKHLNVVDWGADKITTSSDGLTYTFHIRPGQAFSDGTPVKASDYAYAMNRSLDPCLKLPASSESLVVRRSQTNAYYLWAIKDAQTFTNETCANGTHAAAAGQTTPVIQTLVGDSIVADDGAGTLTITLAQPAAYFLEAMTYSTSYALEQKVVTGPNLGADDHWLDNLTQGSPTGQGGSGMFYIAKWDHAGNLVLKANPHWWGINAGKKPYLSEVDFHIFASTDTAYAAYNSDPSYAYSGGIPIQQLAQARTQPDYHSAPWLGVGGVAMNWNVPPFNNADARQAFCLAINRDAIVHTVFNDAYIPTWHLVPQGMPGYNPSLTGIDGVTSTAGDQAKAQAHWKAYTNSLNGQPVPAISYTFDPSDPTAELMANTLLAQWNQTLPGANAQLAPISASPDEHPTTPQLYRSGWTAEYPDPQDFLTLLYATTSSYNDQHASLPAADVLMQQADAMSNPRQATQRLQLYNQAEQMLVQYVAFCPVFQYANQYRLRSWVHNFALDAQGNEPTTDWPSVYIEKH